VVDRLALAMLLPAFALGSAVGCAKEHEAPPELRHEAPPAKSCNELAAINEEVVAQIPGRIQLGPDLAGCVADGLVCPLDPVPGDSCAEKSAASRPYAICASNVWVGACTAPDGGAPDGGDDLDGGAPDGGGDLDGGDGGTSP
jgi:hypothetical protein